MKNKKPANKLINKTMWIIGKPKGYFQGVPIYLYINEQGRLTENLAEAYAFRTRDEARFWKKTEQEYTATKSKFYIGKLSCRFFLYFN